MSLEEDVQVQLFLPKVVPFETFTFDNCIWKKTNFISLGGTWTDTYLEDKNEKVLEIFN